MGEICLLGHSLGGDLARYLATEFPQIQALILLDGGLSGYGKDPAS
ncbi:MAG: acyl-CoA thioester hydrolase/BAAT C-terminal domain-containing protein [Streptococcus sp.]